MPTYQKTAYLFPGQGAQYCGMGADLYARFAVVRETYAEAGDALGYDIAAMSFNAPADVINLTRHTQPLLLTHSIACLRAFTLQTDEAAPVTPAMAVGHSLGEYCALVSAGALSFGEALRLVKTRGELMGEYGRGEMEALMIDFDSAAELAAQHYCGVAACNLPEQNVVGGDAEDLDALLRSMAARFPRKRSTRLKTEGAFHTYHMIDAATRFRNTLERAEFAPPRFDVLSNFSGDFHTADIDSLKSRLFLQLFNPVMWHANLTQVVAAGADLLIEFGGGLGKGETPADRRPALEGIVKKTCRGADNPPAYLSVINVGTLEASLSALA